MRASYRIGICIGFLVLPTLVFAATYVNEWGTPGSGPGQFDIPTDIAVSPLGPVYVADAGNARVQYFDETGQYLGEFGSAGLGPGEFIGSLALDLDASLRVYVLRSELPEIAVFSETGTYLESFGSGSFSNPQGITIGNSMEFIFVADTGNDRIVKLGLDGTQLGAWGSHGTGAGFFDGPVDLVEFDGSLYVLDEGNDRVQVFDLNGIQQGEWGGTGAGDGQFNAPEGIGATWGGRIYVADTGNQRMQSFSLSGSFLEAWGSLGTGPGEFDGPTSVDALSDFLIVGKFPFLPVYVLDQGNNRVQIFEGPCIPSFEPIVEVSSAGGDVLITPAGNGPSLADAGATITVTIADNCGGPIAGYPFQDIWWNDPGTGELSFCLGGSIADGNTNATGTTTISGSARGGGFTQQGALVYVSGMPMLDYPLAFEVNSPDLNGDLTVNLADVGEFATDFHNAQYDFRSDLARDGAENLADVGVLAAHVGETCP